MLAIQPISLNSNPKNTSFKGVYDNKESYENEKRYFEEQRREFDGILNDSNIPEGMKKPFKLARIITNGVVDGLAVGWAVVAGANSCKKVAGSKFVKNIGDAAKPIAQGFTKSFKNFSKLIKNSLKKLSNSKYGKKVVDAFDGLYNKFTTSKIGKTITESAKKVSSVVKEDARKIADFIKSVTYDRATKTTAGVLGGGSGIAGAYATAREENPVEIEEGEV